MGKSTISMAIFNSYVSLPEGISLLSIELHEIVIPFSDRPAYQNVWNHQPALLSTGLSVALINAIRKIRPVSLQVYWFDDDYEPWTILNLSNG